LLLNQTKHYCISNSTEQHQPAAWSSPVDKKERIIFLDSLRGIALLGILLMNIMGQSQPFQYYESMNLSQPITGANFYAWLVECFFFEGTMRGLFSLLFGAGTILLLTRLVKEKSGLEPADIYYRRMLWLLVFGLINAFIFLWPGDILYPYAICGLLLFPFRNLSPRNLILIALFFLAVGTYRENSDFFRDKKIIQTGQAIAAMDTTKVKLTDQQKADLGRYKGFKENNSKEATARAAEEQVKKKIRGKSYPALLQHFRDVNMWIQSFYFYEHHWFDILLFFFLGMALFKSGFLLGNKQTWLYAIIAVVGIGVGLLMNYFYLRTQYRLRFDNYLFTRQWKFNYYHLRRTFQTLGYLSLLILMYKVTPIKKIFFSIFVAVGQMAFTNYLMQSIITSIVFYGFGLYGKLQRYEAYYVVGCIWLFQIIFSHIWMKYFRFGPFEWIWRSLTYLHTPPFRRKKELPKAV
jgi:uncharacterized protein